MTRIPNKPRRSVEEVEAEADDSVVVTEPLAVDEVNDPVEDAVIESRVGLVRSSDDIVLGYIPEMVELTDDERSDGEAERLARVDVKEAESVMVAFVGRAEFVKSVGAGAVVKVAVSVVPTVGVIPIIPSGEPEVEVVIAVVAESVDAEEVESVGAGATVLDESLEVVLGTDAEESVELDACAVSVDDEAAALTGTADGAEADTAGCVAGKVQVIGVRNPSPPTTTDTEMTGGNDGSAAGPGVGIGVAGDDSELLLPEAPVCLRWCRALCGVFQLS